ncbi:hypothetical protein [Paenibacillus sp. NPDC057967]|uniref:hypothetical protein n=1 Tax=Paenibacillus sp. NPDC057967 TaxID=3346293 RepID=UPI0036D7F931
MTKTDEMFRVGVWVGDAWFGGGFDDFLGWLSSEQRKCIPRGPCGQSMWITSGAAGLNGKYPTFLDAYQAWKKEAESHGEETGN